MRRIIDLGVFSEFVCPKCNSPHIIVLETVFLGLHTLAKCSCNSCFINFYHTYPVGHSTYFPVSFSEDGIHKQFSNNSASWFALPLISSFFSNEEVAISVTITNRKEVKDGIILNCLDNCYGHCLSKLLNVQSEVIISPNKDIIVVVPESLQWLVPEEVAEIWIVKGPLKLLNKRLKGFDNFVKKQLKRFNSIRLSLAYLHHDFPSIDLEKFTKVRQFDYSQFNNDPKVITFVFREDRVWLDGPLMNFLWKACTKLSLGPVFKVLFVNFQNYRIAKTAKFISKEINDVIFYAVGMGRTGYLSTRILDKRTSNSTKDNQEEWCRIYSKSHLVIGMHGSNMFLPSGLSAGFIEILPRERILNYMEDIIMNKPHFFNNFLSRFVDIYSSPKLVARHAVEMIRGFPQIYSESLLKSK